MAEQARIWLFEGPAAAAGRAYRTAAIRPGWIARAAMLAFLAVIITPLVLLLFFAAAVGLVVFLALSGANAVWQRVRSIGPRRDGRENVRVILRDDAD